mgnify:CR=1 FL=1
MAFQLRSTELEVAPVAVRPVERRVDPHLQSHGTLAVKVVAAGVGIDCNGSNANILVVGPHTV